MKTVYKSIVGIIIYLVTLNVSLAQTKLTDSLDLLDYSNDTKKHNKVFPENYETALSTWKDIEEIHDWIAHNFRYDLERAKSFANNSKDRGNLSIYKPDEFYKIQKGICVDLSRFAYKTAKHINPDIEIKYLKIEFEPITIEGKKFVNHWLATYKKGDKHYFFADSKRPEKLAGPYASVETFIETYEKFRNRKILSFKLLNSYKRKNQKSYKSKKTIKS